MSDDTTSTEIGTSDGSHWLRWLVLIALAIGAIVAGRKLALGSADKEFEERLHRADDNRD